MPRVRDIKNEWGVQGGPNPQRSDLWQVDIEALVRGLNEQDTFRPMLQTPRRYATAALGLPEMKVRAEPIRRDSRSYNMPSWDEPLDAIRLSFIMDDGGAIARSQDDLHESEIYKMLDVWRRLVRTGRGAVGVEPSARLNNDFSIIFRFPIYLYLCRGSSVPPVSATSQRPFTDPGSPSQQATFDSTTSSRSTTQQTRVAQNDPLSVALVNGLQVSNIICLEECWLSSFKIGDLNYDQAKVLTIDAMVYAENIFRASAR